jgi:hypothetical protein
LRALLDGTEDSKEAAKMQITTAMQLWQSSKNEGTCRNTNLNAPFGDVETIVFNFFDSLFLAAFQSAAAGLKELADALDAM